MDWKGALGLTLGFVVYLLAGAAIFQVLEGENETSAGVNYQSELTAWFNNYTCMDQEGLERLVTLMVEYQNTGGNVATNSTTAPNWDYISSVFFSITVVTTIGYGNISPSTTGGQVFLVFYALLGIPLCGLLLATVGDKLGGHAKSLEKMVLLRMGSDQKKRARLIYLFLLVVIAFAAFISFPAVMFMIAEGWSFGISFYYAFVTLSTIGFGDYVAGTQDESYRVFYKVMLCLWIFVGLAWFALVISLMTDSMKGWGHNLRKKVEEQEEHHHKSKKPVPLKDISEGGGEGTESGSEADAGNHGNSTSPSNAVMVVSEVDTNGKKSDSRNHGDAAGHASATTDNVQLTSVKPVSL